ncbi:hypothetical protein [Aureivirga sp. CE67]|nr:hypothetical protein [Aureivirga sp. CE67]
MLKYFNSHIKIKKWKSDFSLVVLWKFSNNIEYFGLTENNDLIIMESRFV